MTQFDDQIIANLELPFEVFWTLSEGALLSRIDEANRTQSPLLFYFWTPHQAFAKYDLTRVFLPEHTDACYASASSGGVDCDYPVAELYKIVGKRLYKDSMFDPASYLLQKFALTTEDQIEMLAARSYGGRSFDQAACDWVLANREKWSSWIMDLTAQCGRGEYIKQGDCIPCHHGEFLPVGTIAPTSCSLCPMTGYQPNRGATDCLECPTNTRAGRVGSTDVNECVCKETFYHPLGVNGTGRPCLPCPIGATCPGGTALPKAKQGFWSPLTEEKYLKEALSQSNDYSQLWQQVNMSQELWACINGEACPGDIIPGNYCVAGHTGRMCYECEVGYFQFSGACFPCTHLSEQYKVVVVIMIILIIAIWVAMNRLAAVNIDAVDISLVFLQIMAVMGTYKLSWPAELQQVFSAVSFVNFNLDLLSPQCLTGTYSFFSKWLLNMALPLIYLVGIALLSGVVITYHRLRERKRGRKVEDETMQNKQAQRARRLSVVGGSFATKIAPRISDIRIVAVNSVYSCEDGEDGGEGEMEEGTSMGIERDAAATRTEGHKSDVRDEIELDPVSASAKRTMKIKQKEGPNMQERRLSGMSGDRPDTASHLQQLLSKQDDSALVRAEKLESFIGKAYANGGSFLDIVYAMIVDTVFSAFPCDKLGDKFVLVRDPNIECYSSVEHQVRDRK
mmetsp:Transcript_25652/g.64474  ORF Transcript_25652/g.64474 Transcript_25652/m.64474 type:complete len:678 (+) Transcript_25652:48-2081(+)